MSTVVLTVPAATKRRWLKAATFAKRLEQFVTEAADAYCEPRCGKCGHPMETVHPVTGDRYERCLVCWLREQLDAERATVAKLQEWMEEDSKPNYIEI